jgi:hypothetical protein
MAYPKSRYTNGLKGFDPISEETGSLTTKDIAVIQKENLRMKQEIEILKKAMAILAKKAMENELIKLIHQQKDDPSDVWVFDRS